MKRSEMKALVDRKQSHIRAGVLRVDGADTVIAAEELVQIRTHTYDLRYTNLRGREVLPVDNSINPGVEHSGYDQYGSVGAAIIISSYSSRIPRADVFRKRFASRMRGIAIAYGISVQEMRASAYAGIPLDGKKASAARRAFEELVDKIAREGDASHGLIGINNIPNASTYVVPNGAGGQTKWKFKTPDEINADMCGIVTGIISSTNEIERPNYILLPTEQYQYISTTPRSSVSDTTILEFFQKAHADITVESWFALKAAGVGGADRMIAYSRDPDHLVLQIPLEFTQMTPEWEGLELVTACEGRIGGVQCFYPMSVSYGDGI